MSRVTISMKAARHAEIAMVRYLREDPETAPLVEIRDALRRAERVTEPKRKPPDAAGIALARELKRRANATRRAVGLPPLKSKRKPSAWALQAKAARSIAKAQKRDRRASIREAVFKRSEVNGVPRCEGPLFFNREDPDRCGNLPKQLAHAFGRGKGRRPECVENCMALCDVCAYQETNNIPDAAFWWNFRAEFFERYGYTAEARAARDRLAFVEARSMLGAGLKERHRAKAEEEIRELEQKVHKAVFGEENQR